MDKLLNIINIIKKNNNQNVLDHVSDDMHLRDDIGFSSLDLAELTVRIESEFNVDIFEEDILYTIKDVRSKLGA